MTKKRGNYRIPFAQTAAGWKMLEYSSLKDPDTVPAKQYSWYEPQEWRTNTPFDATIVLGGSSRGRSAVRVHCECEERKDSKDIPILITAVFETDGEVNWKHACPVVTHRSHW